MNAKKIDGKLFAEGLQAKVAGEVSKLKTEYGVTPGLAVVLVGNDPASEVYVRSKRRRSLEAGMNSFEHKMPAETRQEDLLNLIAGLNEDPAVHGILVQLPLPIHIDSSQVLAAISPSKDVDGFHVTNVGLLGTGQKAMIPCTPLGCLLLLRDQVGDLAGLEAVVLGRSNVVGKPMLQLLLSESCTVTVAHSRTRNLPDVVRRADIVVAAVGRPEMVRKDWIKPGAVVLDVGINRISDLERRGTKLVGDVAYDEVSDVASAITPVPGGVGPMTIACLLANTLVACCRINGISEPGVLSP